MFNNRMMKGLGRWIIYTGYLMTVVLSLPLIRAEISCGQERPKILRMALIPTEDIEEMVRAFEPSKKYLEKELGMEIEHFKATDYTAVVEAMRSKKIDVAYFGPFSYVLTAKWADTRAIIGGSEGDGKLATYNSIFITHRDSGLKTMDDVKEPRNKLTASFVDPASTSGHLIPRGHLESIGIRVSPRALSPTTHVVSSFSLQFINSKKFLISNLCEIDLVYLG